MPRAASSARAWIGTIVFLFLAPGVVPTEALVVTGIYRFVRNPMYPAVLTIILGDYRRNVPGWWPRFRSRA